MKSGKGCKKLNRREAFRLAGAAAATLTLQAGYATAAADGVGAPKTSSKRSKNRMSEVHGISVEDRLAMRALLHEYYWLADHGPMEKITGLYTEDGHLIGPGKFINGWKALRKEVALQTNNDVTRHISSNFRLALLDDCSVQGTEVLRVYRRRPGENDSMLPSVVADIYWIFKRSDDGQWKVALRYVEAAFRNTST
jgi:hypothetical protein